LPSGIFGFLLIQIIRHPSLRLQGSEFAGFIPPKIFFGNTFAGAGATRRNSAQLGATRRNSAQLGATRRNSQ
jgi:hypothetical protein